VVLAVAAIFVGLGYMLFRELDGPPTEYCTVTAAGVAYRRSNAVEIDQAPDGRVGDRYRSNSGCLPLDSFGA